MHGVVYLIIRARFRRTSFMHRFISPADLDCAKTLNVLFFDFDVLPNQTQREIERTLHAGKILVLSLTRQRDPWKFPR